MRQSLASKHAETVRESEKQMRLLQQERQAVFQDAFQSDLQYYKEVGKIPSKFIHLMMMRYCRSYFKTFFGFSVFIIEIKIEQKSSQQTLSLEEIVLDNELENKELDKFLED